MADSQLTKPVASIFNRLAKHFNRKFAQIVLTISNHKKAGSLGALAGFAIAVLFTWKFLRSPVRLWRREHKEAGSGSNSGSLSQANEVPSFSENQQIENAEEVELFDEIHPLEKSTLAQGVKKKLYGSRKMTCQLLGVILEESSPEELQEHATVRSSVMDVLLEISKFCDIYLMERILDDESGERVISALQNAGLFKTGGLMKDKVLFCSTENGRSSFVRHLEPDWHVDTNPEILSQLSRFIRNPLYISPARSSFASASNILSSRSLELYFAEDCFLDRTTSNCSPV
ncbi:peroxisome biogenesis protein 22-like isoform X1 [Actinidia eriantha]|uniref:peroxisome biogenesis protein 22-like isoform X1 n=1 Tax=Actinidia eriantha TaxID=165200 RepID=UPI002589F7C9|nr:peroxisome biogenesis protein 22-like isoform X1 [Actinidia eriantha]XP_057493455.1 peroxisome biogenesis protein 22-like isoform X1 [Actinidia eriantha]